MNVQAHAQPTHCDPEHLTESQQVAFEAAASLGIPLLDPTLWDQRPESYIYLTIDLINYQSGKLPFAYIGSRDVRSGSLRSEFVRYKGSGSHLWRAINKRGWSNFATVAIEICTGNRFKDHEQVWLDRYQCATDPRFYNIFAGASGFSSADIKRIQREMGPDGRSAARAKQLETMGPDRQSAARAKQLETMGPDRRSAARAKRLETMGPDRRSAAAAKRNETVRHQIAKIRAECIDLICLIGSNPVPEHQPRGKGNNLAIRRWSVYRDALKDAQG